MATKGMSSKTYCSIEEFRDNFLSKESLSMLNRMNQAESTRIASMMAVDVRAIIEKGLRS